MASSGRVDIGTCKILLVCEEPHHVYQVWWILAPPIDSQRHGGPFAIWEPNGAHNTIDTNVGAYNTACVRAVVEYYFRRRTWYGPGIVV